MPIKTKTTCFYRIFLATSWLHIITEATACKELTKGCMGLWRGTNQEMGTKVFPKHLTYDNGITGHRNNLPKNRAPVKNI